MEAPEYLICVNCETPCYTFEWEHGQASEALCMTCGVDELDEFVTEDEFEAMASAD